MEVIEGSVQNQAFYFWIVHGEPSRGVASKRPTRHHDVLNLKAQLVDSKLHHCINSLGLLVWVRCPSRPIEARMVPAKNTISTGNWSTHDSNLIKSSIALAADYQSFTIYVFLSCGPRTWCQSCCRPWCQP